MSPAAEIRNWPVEAERSVLGQILSAASCSLEAGHRIAQRVEAVGLDPCHFGTASHRGLYGLMLAMTDRGIPVDPISVAAEIDRQHADPHLIAHLRVIAAEVTAWGTCEHHARIVIDAAVAREIEERGS